MQPLVKWYSSSLIMMRSWFSCGGEGFHVEEEKGVYHELVHKKGIPSIRTAG